MKTHWLLIAGVVCTAFVFAIVAMVTATTYYKKYGHGPEIVNAFDFTSTDSLPPYIKMVVTAFRTVKTDKGWDAYVFSVKGVRGEVLIFDNFLEIEKDDAHWFPGVLIRRPIDPNAAGTDTLIYRS